VQAARPHRNSEHGGSSLKAVVTIAIIAALGFVAFKVAPPLMDKYQLQDAVTTEARFAIATHKNEEQKRADVMKKIKDLGIPATDQDLVIVASQETLSITVKYSVPVDLILYKFDMDCTVSADSHAL
jgi:Flp pilus assembly protein TadG